MGDVPLIQNSLIETRTNLLCRLFKSMVQQRVAKLPLVVTQANKQKKLVSSHEWCLIDSQLTSAESLSTARMLAWNLYCRVLPRRNYMYSTCKSLSGWTSKRSLQVFAMHAMRESLWSPQWRKMHPGSLSLFQHLTINNALWSLSRISVSFHLFWH